MPTPTVQRVIAFAMAVVLASVAASVASTQFVLAGLAAIDVPVSVPTRLLMTITDLRILVTLLPATVACFLPAFWIASFAIRRFGGRRVLWFALAGGSALIIELLIVQAALGLMPVGGARTPAGLAAMGFAGAFGGYLFARLAPAAQLEV